MRALPGEEELRVKALGPDYISSEIRRAASAVALGTKVFAGIDVGIPVREEDLGPGATAPPTLGSRQGVRDAVLAALSAGADGIVVSRKYSEMMLEDLSGVGDAIREWQRRV